MIFLIALVLSLGVANTNLPITDITQQLQGELEIEIVVDKDSDGKQRINRSGQFSVLFSNNSDNPIQLWKGSCRQGYNSLLFEIEIDPSSFSSMKKRKIHEANWENKRDETITIPPGGTYSWRVGMSDIWGQRVWESAPEPNTGKPVKLTAVFRSDKTEASSKHEVWTGQIKSKQIDTLVVDSRLNTPHEYLQSDCPKQAIKSMKGDNSWIHRKDNYQRTPLHIAARHSQLEVVEWLAANGADVNAIAYNGFTPLHLASDFNVIAAILREKPDLTIKCRSQGHTAMQNAVSELSSVRSKELSTKWRRIVDLYKEMEGEFDLFTAIHLGNLEEVKKILEASPKIADDFQGRSPLRIAASLGHLGICTYLIENFEVDVNDFERGSGYPIIKSSVAYPDVARLLIGNGADLEKRITWMGGRTGISIIGDDATILHFAARDGVPDTIKLLIDAGVDIFASTKGTFGNDDVDQTALDVTAFFGRVANAKEIIQHPKFKEVHLDTRLEILDRCLLMAARVSRSTEEANACMLIKLLLDNGADPNALGKKGQSAVQIAARAIHPTNEKENNVHKETVSILLRNGAKLDLFSAVAIGDEEAVTRLLTQESHNINVRARDGYPALHFAVRMNNQKIVKLLLSAGADPNIRNENNGTGTFGGTPLHSAAFWDRVEIAEMLIGAGAEVNARGKKGSTPLHSAARMTNAGIVQLLLENGADKYAKDLKGESPLDWCRKLNRTNADAIEKIFKEHQKK